MNRAETHTPSRHLAATVGEVVVLQGSTQLMHDHPRLRPRRYDLLTTFAPVLDEAIRFNV